MKFVGTRSTPVEAASSKPVFLLIMLGVACYTFIPDNSLNYQFPSASSVRLQSLKLCDGSAPDSRWPGFHDAGILYNDCKVSSSKEFWHAPGVRQIDFTTESYIQGFYLINGAWSPDKDLRALSLHYSNDNWKS